MTVRELIDKAYKHTGYKDAMVYDVNKMYSNGLMPECEAKVILLSTMKVVE